VSDTTDTVVYGARAIYDMKSSQSVGTALAISDGVVVRVGRLGEVVESLGGSVRRDDRFADAILLPGFVESHCHLRAIGALEQHPWVGPEDRRRSDGATMVGSPHVDHVLATLRGLMGTTPRIFAFGYDPTRTKGPLLDRWALDTVSTSRPVVVMNASAHVAYANSAALNEGGAMTSDDPGVLRDGDGVPTGVLNERAMALVTDLAAFLGTDVTKAVHAGAHVAARAGVTTASELALFAAGDDFTTYRAAVQSAPIRVAYSPLMSVMSSRWSPDELLEHLRAIREHDNDRFFMGPLKWILDGSIQGRTAALNYPGYCGGDAHDTLFYEAPELTNALRPFHNAGYAAAIHSNGDRAIDVAIEALQSLLAEAPRTGHGHRLEHVQMATSAHIAALAKLDVAVNLFINHVYYWGDVHAASTMGPEKAERLDPAKDVLDAGVTLALHSDAPVTPLDPLFSAWCALSRTTSSGRVLGPDQRLTRFDALRAITTGPAQQIGAHHRGGVLEPGAWADVVALEDDPFEVELDALPHIGVRGTVVGGVPVA
jgi:predicted amidohydrolase YtcJ